MIYLAHTGDGESYGSQLFRVLDDDDAGYKRTYFPEREGRRCELVDTVPFRPNTMLAFLNSRGAHGASIAESAPPDVARFSYQFYVAPRNEMPADRIRRLPKDLRAKWRNKPAVTAGM